MPVALKAPYATAMRLWVVYSDILDERRNYAVAILRQGCGKKTQMAVRGLFGGVESEDEADKISWNIVPS